MDKRAVPHVVDAVHVACVAHAVRVTEDSSGIHSPLVLHTVWAPVAAGGSAVLPVAPGSHRRLGGQWLPGGLVVDSPQLHMQAAPAALVALGARAVAALAAQAHTWN